MTTRTFRKCSTTGMNKITDIITGSIADELNIIPGSKLLTVNNRSVKDVFDYQFLIADEYVTFEIENQDGSIDEYEIEKDFDDDLGLVFESSLMDDYKSCSNKCIFCFIDQMPPGMRETLYFKDDDSRLSFLQGNYITLTNMKDEDIDRIIKYHMSPINISVHTTNPELRCKMMNNRFAGDKLKYLKKFYDAGITMNAQIVLCKGINDGAELERTINDLSGYAPVLESVSVVPVGLTKYRDGLFPLEPITKKDAEAVINLVEEYQKIMFEMHDIHFVHASDELYLLAEKELPPEEDYDGYLQLENGVGMLRLFYEEFNEALNDPEIKGALQKKTGRKASVATGVLPSGFLKNLINDNKIPGCEIYPVKNNFFGESITVSGLVCGCDIISQLKDKDLGDELFIPVNMLRSGERYFLDDITIETIEKELNINVKIVPNSGEAFLRAILGLDYDLGGRVVYEQADCGDSWQA